MILKNQIKRILTGLTIPQEYVCLDSKEFLHPLSVLLSLEKEKTNLDVSASHLFIGYKPLILALPFKVNDHNYQFLKNQNQLSLNFDNSDQIQPKILAQLALKKVAEKVLGEDAVLFYEGMNGNHLFLSFIHQWINRQREKFRTQPSNNVNLPGNLIDQVRIAYSVPRRISIITVNDGSSMNMFPTDLHGPVGEKFYCGSLRIGGMANSQIEKYKQLVVSEVEPAFYKNAYALGKNHMREFQNENQFLLHQIRSKNFNSPLPSAVTSYRELQRMDSFDIGIHRIHLYKVIHQQIVQDNRPSLTHIHQYYAQWRLNHGLDTSMLLR